MSSTAEIGNLALSHARQDASIIDLATDNTTQARRLRRIYKPTLMRITQMFPWWFSEKPLSVSALDVTPYDGFNYVYQIPGDVLEVSKVATEDMSFTDVSPESDTTIFKVFSSSDGLTKQIHTTIEIDKAMCVTTVKTNNILDPLFVNYFAYELAIQLANLYKVSAENKKSLLQEWAVAKNEAMTSSAIQEDTEFDSYNKYVDARGGN